VQYPSLYRAKAVAVTGGRVKAFIPQVFGDTEVTITAYLGGPPTEPGMGWVTFQAGNPEFPVWMGVGVITLSEPTDTGGGEGADEVWIGPNAPSDPAIELWYDPDAAAPGAGPGGSYVHNQATPSATWVINHGLGFFPGVQIENSAGDDVEGDVTHDSALKMTVRFSASFSGKAYLS
jgi:hypothetical protein